MKRVNQKYSIKSDIFLVAVFILFSLVVTLISFEYGIATLLAGISTLMYYFIFEKSILFLIQGEVSKLSVISIYIISLLRYVCIGGGVITIFFLFSSMSVRIYTVIFVISVWFLCTWMRNRR